MYNPSMKGKTMSYTAKYGKKYREENKKRIAKYQKKYHKENREEILEKRRVLAKSKGGYQTRKEQNAYYNKNKEKIQAQRKASFLAKPQKEQDKIRAYEKQWAKEYGVRNRAMLSIKGKKWREKVGKEYMANYHKNHNKLRKETIFNAEGNKCKCCGETDPIYFQIDHINNDGYLERSMKFYERYPGMKGVKKASYTARGFNESKVTISKYLASPEKYQLLCANCNVAKHLNGGKLYKPKKRKPSAKRN